MKIIAPYQISSEILNVINEAQKYLIIVSPYVNFNNWDRIKVDLENAKKRNVQIIFYTRLDDENFKSWEQIKQLGIKPHLIKNLHSKLYFNERKGIVTSMNLLTSSSINSIEFGSIYESENELEELKKYIKQYLEPNVIEEIPNDEDLYLSKEKFRVVFQNFISNNLKRNVYCKYENGGFSFNAGNSYSIQLLKAKNNLNITSILSEDEADNFKEFENMTRLKSMDIELNRGTNGSYSTIELTNTQKYSNSNFDFLLVNEKKEILDIAITFILDLNEFKDKTYKQ
jgi:PLD-like domain